MTTLAEFIEASKETQAAIAAKLRISKAYMSDLVNDNRRPGLELAVRIERLTGGKVPASSWISEELHEEPAAGVGEGERAA
ncbi:MAG: helix-turn-helix transcriptional regulator [Rhodobacteraceae bacterium]|nr:helix-turn-helix transcriptional regulator [Paracoccaceae bacterium]MBR9823711.1 helix-turn-helix transcriptional regulator [Paracoccaceae bacterium]